MILLKQRRFQKPKFLNPSSAPPDPPTMLKLVWTLCYDVLGLVFAFITLTIGCAFLYWLGTQSDWGIIPTFTLLDKTGKEVASPAAGFWDCMHFSIVTIATLGYGDYRPQSYARIVAACEVISGIVLMGLFVAKLVSRKQDRFVRRILKGQTNIEIQKFRGLLATIFKNISSAPSVKFTCSLGFFVSSEWPFMFDC